MKKTLPGDVYERFKAALVDGGATSDEDQEAISKALYAWARERGATDYAHWFFPMRGGSGATGGMLGALKCDAFIDLDWSSAAHKSTSESGADIDGVEAMIQQGRRRAATI